MVAPYRPEASACISEKVLGFGRKLPEDSDRSGEPTPCSGENDLRSRTGSAVATAEQPCPKIIAGRLLYSVYYGRISRYPSYSRKETQRERTSVQTSAA